MWNVRIYYNIQMPIVDSEDKENKVINSNRYYYITKIVSYVHMGCIIYYENIYQIKHILMW